MVHKRQLWLFLLLLLLAGIGSMRRAHPAAAAAGFPDLEVIVLIDESDSMWTETDVEDRRTEALELLINTLTVLEVSNSRLAIIPFASSKETQIIGGDFVDVSNAAAVRTLLSRYQQQHAAPDRGDPTTGWTDIYAAFELAHALLQSSHQPGAKPVVLLLSDGGAEKREATWRNRAYDLPEAQAAWPAYIESVRYYDKFADIVYEGEACPAKRASTPVHVFTFRRTAEPGDDRDLWEAFAAQFEDLAITGSSDQDRALAALREFWVPLVESSGGNYDEIQEDDLVLFQQELNTALLDFLRTELCVQVDLAQDIDVDGTAAVTSLVDADYGQVIFSFAKSNVNIAITMTDAAGQPVSPDEARTESSTGLSETWAITRPDEDSNGWAGEWVLTFAGTGTVSLSRIYYAISGTRLQIVQPPAGVLPLGPTLRITAQLLDGAGNPLPDTDIEGVAITVTTPDGQQFTLDEGGIEIAAGGLSASVPAERTNQEGVYQIAINITAQGREFNQAQQFTLSGQLPWLKLTQPANGERYAVNEIDVIEGTIMRGAEEADGGVGQYAIQASLWQVQESNETPIGEYDLAWDDATQSRFASVPGVLADLPAGDYYLQMDLSYTPPNGSQVTPPQDVVYFAVQEGEAEPTAAAPTATPRLAATVTPIPATATPTATPEPISLPQMLTNIPAWAVYAFIGVVLFGLLLVFRASVAGGDRPNLKYLEVIDDSRVEANNYAFGPYDPRSYWGRTLNIYGRDNQVLARIRVQPDEDGPVVQVVEVAEGQTLTYMNRPYLVGGQFLPKDQGQVAVGDVKIRFRGIDNR